jgi:hypothetical protein
VQFTARLPRDEPTPRVIVGDEASDRLVAIHDDDGLALANGFEVAT